MIHFTYDNGTVEPLTFILSTRDHRHLGQLSNIDEIKFTSNLNSADEASFVIYKVMDNHEEILWDELTDLRLIYIVELDEYFEITVELSDRDYMIKTVTATSVCESELSQVYLHNIEINTPDDIARPDYDPNYPTLFWRNIDEPGITDAEKEKRRNSSLIHRILEKVPAYTIEHIDSSLSNLQREFSISDETIYDFLTGDCAEQFNCLFKFDSVNRTISAYDLYSNCINDNCPYYINDNNEYYRGFYHLRYRGEAKDICPYCGQLINYYGEDTLVFISTENLTDEVNFETDVDSIKNCFRLEAGDDDMTAAVINSNPNGSQYIYEFSPESRHDMPEEIVSLMDDYDVLYDYWNNEKEIYIDSDAIATFNNICEKYNDTETYHQGSNKWVLMPETDPIIGYTNLIPYYYECIDFGSYLKSSMMPTPNTSGQTVEEAIDAIKTGMHIIDSYGGDLGLSYVNQHTTLSTIDNGIKAYAKIFVKTGFVKIEIEHEDGDGFIYGGTDSQGNNYGTWTGGIKVTDYNDDTIYDILRFSYRVTDDLATFMREKILKQLDRNSKDDYIYDVLSIDISDAGTEQFREALVYYSANRLQSFIDSLQAVIGILIDAGQGSDGSTLKESFYDVYYDRINICQEELDLRNTEIEKVYGTFVNGFVQTKGMLQLIGDKVRDIQGILNFRNYLGEENYKIFTTYIREDTYTNSNYISDNLDNNQMFDNARQFMERAKEELHKSATYQHSISTNLNNLLAINAFKPIINKFELGNWIRVKADDTIYRLRLISYSIDYDNLETINTEFSDVTITANGLNDINSILKQASSMASSYGYVQQQAETGSNIKTNYIDEWIDNGLNSVFMKINSNNDEDIQINSSGIIARTYDDIEDDYSPKQLRITHNTLAFTNDKWASVKTALGEFEMTYHPVNNDKININTTPITESMYGLVADAVLAGKIVGSVMESNTFIGGHVQCIGNSNYIDLSSETLDSERKDFLHCGDNFLVDKTGKVKSKSGIFESNNGYYINLSNDYSGNYNHIIKIGDNFNVDSNGNGYFKGNIYATDGTFNGTIYANRGEIAGWEINDTELFKNDVSLSSNGTISGFKLQETGGKDYLDFTGDGTGYLRLANGKVEIQNEGTTGRISCSRLSATNDDGTIDCKTLVVNNSSSSLIQVGFQVSGRFTGILITAGNIQRYYNGVLQSTWS